MKLTQSIYLVGGGVWGGMGLSPGPDCNVYLLDGGDALALVDTGSGTPASVDAICAQIEADGFDPARIGTVLLTHMHGDHAGGAARFAELTGAVVRGSALTADVLARGDEEASSVRLAREAGVFPADFELRPLAGIETVAAGDVITVGRLSVEAVDTPGHCDGHVSFVVRSEGRADLLAGDAVFWRGRVLMQAIPDCDPYATGRSIERLAGLGPIDGLFSGHGAFVVSGANRHVDAAAEQVRALRVPPGL